MGKVQLMYQLQDRKDRGTTHHAHLAVLLRKKLSV